MRKLVNSVSLLCLCLAAPLAMSPARAEDKLEALTKSEDNWAMQGKNYSANHYSTLTQINAGNVKNLKVSWSFSTGLLSGHEGSPLVVDGKIFIHTSFPNNTFALSLDDPTRILWQDKPKQNAAARAVACCDIVNRGLAYWRGDGKTPSLIIKTLLDGNVVALNADTGQLYWKVENSDYKVGSTLTVAPRVFKDVVLIGSSGAELGVRGYMTAYDVRTGEQKWRAYATGPDSDVLIGDDFNKANPHYGQKGLGTSTWEGDAWKIGGGTNWGWFAYDPDTNLVYYGSGNPAPWNETMRPRFRPPDIDYDDGVLAKLVGEPPLPVRVVELPKPLPLPGQLKPLGNGRPVPEAPDPAVRVNQANAAARVQPVRNGFINAVQVYPFASGALYQVYTAPGEITDVALQEGEQLVGSGPVAAGDTVRWIIGDTESGVGAAKKIHILVKPTRPDITTNLVINTDRRTYLLELRSTEKTYMASVSWQYPEDQLIALRRQNQEAEAAAPVDKGVDLASINFRYAIQGDNPAWRPLRAFDDGQKVYIEFPRGIPQGEMPPLFVIGPAGGSELVNYRANRNYYIVDRLFAAAELRIGDKDSERRVRIVRSDGRPRSW